MVLIRAFSFFRRFSPDRDPHPAVSSIKYLQQHIVILIEGMRKTGNVLEVGHSQEAHFRIENRSVFAPLSQFSMKYFLSIDSMTHMNGHPKASDGNCDQHSDIILHDIIPSESARMSIDVSDYSRYARLGHKVFLNFRCYHRNKVEWMEKDVPIAMDQIELIFFNESITSIPPKPRSMKGIRWTEDVKSITIWIGEERTSVIDKAKGAVTNFYDRKGEDIFFGGNGMSPNFTRAATDNDMGGIDRSRKIMPTWVAFTLGLVERATYYVRYLDHFSYLLQWRRIGLDSASNLQVTCKNIESRLNEDGTVCIYATNQTHVGRTILFEQQIIYRFHDDNSIEVSTRTRPKRSVQCIPSIPRIGYRFCVRKELNNCVYFGRGPGENYQDRKAGDNAFGIWASSPNKMRYNYIVPSENGGRSDCYWAAFTNDQGEGLMIVGAEPIPLAAKADQCTETFDFSALLHSQEELHAATHVCDLEQREEGKHPIFVNIDSFAMGIGGDIGWGPCCYPQYTLKTSETYTARFWLYAKSSNEDPSFVGRQKAHTA